MEKIYILFITSLFIVHLNAQEATVDWAITMTGTVNTFPSTITTDTSGNLYLTGEFLESVDFDPGPDSFILTSNGSFDGFIQKLDPDGNLIWVKSIGGLDQDRAASISTDNDGNIYITGFYMGLVDFDPGIGTYNLTSNGLTDIFILKLDTNGNFIWAKSIGGSSSDYGQTVITDNLGNIYLSGSFEDSLDFDLGAGTEILSSNGLSDIFLQKLDIDGNFLWVRSNGGIGHDYPNSITLDNSGNLLVTGNFKETVDFDPGTGINNQTSNGNSDAFVQKLDANGNLIWIRTMGSFGLDIANAITTDSSQNVYITGNFAFTVDFDPGEGIYNLSSVNGFSDIFVLKLNPMGNFVWAISMGGNQTDFGDSIITDTSNNVYSMGHFSGAVDLDPGTGTDFHTAIGIQDIYIQKLDTQGNFLWAKSMTSSSFTYDRTSIISDNAGNIYATGFFPSSLGFTIDSEILLPAISSGGLDCFVIKLKNTTLGITENQIFDRVNIFPNPAEEHLTIDFGELINPSVSIYTIQGQLIFEKKDIRERNFKLDLHKSKGIYFVEVYAEGAHKMFKIMKQ